MTWQAPEGMDEYLRPTEYCDSDNQELKRAAVDIIQDSQTPKDAALKIFHFVRDEILFAIDEHTKASDTLRRGTGQCVTKTGLQIALLRASRIPARYHLVDVHKYCLKGLISPNAFNGFEESITDHPWCECYLFGKWISCETLFDKALYDTGVEKGIIRKEEIPTIEWDGESDLITLSFWILKDKGTYPNLDDLIERERKEFAQFWPVLRESNQYTMKLRAEGGIG